MTRRESREAALCLIYEQSFSPEISTDEIIEKAKEIREEKISEFAKQLFNGVCEKKQNIDLRITSSAENWSIDRISRVSLSIIRLAAYEILYAGTEKQIAVNEALELARKYDDEKSVSFINGVLAGIIN
ncbi:MAG: transcription antitermination factor NusB [Clostridia bacterium]|nr:transcription antitermination factor NusB [Clostridia bacterium]